jgi:hypothetical protein
MDENREDCHRDRRSQCRESSQATNEPVTYSTATTTISGPRGGVGISWGARANSGAALCMSWRALSERTSVRTLHLSMMLRQSQNP